MESVAAHEASRLFERLSLLPVVVHVVLGLAQPLMHTVRLFRVLRAVVLHKVQLCARLGKERLRFSRRRESKARTL